MLKYVIKRTGKYEPFQDFKIKDAVEKSFKSVGKNLDESICENVIASLKTKEIWQVEEIQDLIEERLFEKEYFDVMRSFMLYRHTRKLQREHIEGLNDDTTYIDSTQTIQEYISKTINFSSEQIPYSSLGLTNSIAGKVISNYWMDQIYTTEEGYAHRNGDIHIHNLNNITPHCAGWNIRPLLDQGFNGINGEQNSPPSNFREALRQITKFLETIQGEWTGVQTINSFDIYLAPYIFGDNLSFYDVVEPLKEFFLNINSSSNLGKPSLSHITLDWIVPEDLKLKSPIKNGIHLFENNNQPEILERCLEKGVSKPTDLSYQHFQKEINIINKAYLFVCNKGDINGNTFRSPNLTINITSYFDWDAENTNLLFENIAKKRNIYFQNFVGSLQNTNDFRPEDLRSMNSHLFFDLKKLLKQGNGLFGSGEMTGNIGVVTINMARLGYTANGSKTELIRQLDRLLFIAQSTLDKKRAYIQQRFDSGFYPYTQTYLSNYKNHFSSIGVIGVNEMIINLTQGKESIMSPTGKAIATEILDYICQKMKEFQETTGCLYSLEATQDTEISLRFATEDKKRFPNNNAQSDTDNLYYTNGSQIPTGFSNDPFEILTLQDELQSLYNGGTVLELFIGQKESTAESCKIFLKKALTNFKSPYIKLTPTEN